MLKVSGESLKGSGSLGIDPNAVNYLAEQIGQVHNMGVEVGVVIGGGNIWRGEAAQSEGMDRATADYAGMLATVINALALRESLDQQGIPSRVQTAISIQQVAEPYIRLRAIRHLEKGRVVILAGGTGNPFFTTDTTAALRAAEIGAGMVLKATKVDGVYSSDPRQDPNAELLTEVSYLDVISRGLRVMDSTAITMCMDNKLPIRVFNQTVPGNIPRAVRGESIGTLVR